MSSSGRSMVDIGRGGIRRDSGSTSASEIVRTRPDDCVSKTGKSGNWVSLKANVFQIDELKDFEFNQYRVDFEPDLELDKVRKALVGQKISSYGGYVYDGVNTLFITTKLPSEKLSFDCETREGNKYKLTLKDTKQTIDRSDTRVLLVMNIMLRRAMEGLNLKLIQRNLFDAEANIDIKEFRLNLWPGYFTSIRQYENNVLVNCDMRFKIMRKETLYDILRTYLKEDQQAGPDRFKADVLGSIVLANYGNKRTYRVEDVDFSQSPKSTFDWRGKTISYMEYFKQQYGIQINDPNQPMLISTPKDRDFRGGNRSDKTKVCLIPELFLATGLTDSMRNDFRLMRALADHTRMDPKTRVERLLAFNKRLQNTQKSIEQFEQFHTKLCPELVEFKGREIAQETMIFGAEKTCTNDSKNVDWTNPMKTNFMYENSDLKKWVIISPSRAMADTQKFVQLLEEVANGMRYTMSKPKIIEIANDRAQSYTAELQTIIPKDPKLIMVVLPNNGADRYAAVKKLTCINNAIPTQVIVQKTMQPKKGNMGAVKSVATKVLIQMNCKLGGAAWMVKMPVAGCMICGFDVNHDSANKSKSYGAFVAALDLKKKCRFYSSVSSHQQNEECSNNIANHMLKALQAYKELYDTYPERVLFYRDGVGEGDIEFVNCYEVGTINKLFDEVYGGQRPKFAFIIVNKRINLKIFKSISGNRVENPPSGTVVDNTITLPERYDFYLISQSVRQGTVNPTSYNIIYDTFGLEPDRLQMLTYKMCHLYYNWSGTTRVPAVVQYCQKLAMLVGQHLHAPPQASLSNQLYFL